MLSKPTIVLIGRPNVGKSTLFNRLTHSRSAIVANYSGLTRDRQYSDTKIGNFEFTVVDTGGFEPSVRDNAQALVTKQTQKAISESDLILFIVDYREGLNTLDYEIAQELRRLRHQKHIILVLNKAEKMRAGVVSGSDFYELGLGEPYPISAAHGNGVTALVEAALNKLPALPESLGISQENSFLNRKEYHLKLSVVGRPNVGKSTLINTLLNEERLVASDMPGTTRDSIEIYWQYKGQKYKLIDTAGLRKRSRVSDQIEIFSMIKALNAIEASNVVLLVIDAQTLVSEQDLQIADTILQKGRALVIALNKWDSVRAAKRAHVKQELRKKLHFLSFATTRVVSALTGQGMAPLIHAVSIAHAAAFAKLSASKLTRELGTAIAQQPPPRKGIFRPKMRYAHQGGHNPPLIVIHGNGLDKVPSCYERYLNSHFRKAFSLVGTPLRIAFKPTHNPYALRTKC